MTHVRLRLKTELCNICNIKATEMASWLVIKFMTNKSYFNVNFLKAERSGTIEGQYVKLLCSEAIREALAKASFRSSQRLSGCSSIELSYWHYTGNCPPSEVHATFKIWHRTSLLVWAAIIQTGLFVTAGQLYLYT
jgi:hypothetical protein